MRSVDVAALRRAVAVDAQAIRVGFRVEVDADERLMFSLPWIEVKGDILPENRCRDPFAVTGAINLDAHDIAGVQCGRGE